MERGFVEHLADPATIITLFTGTGIQQSDSRSIFFLNIFFIIFLYKHLFSSWACVQHHFFGRAHLLLFLVFCVCVCFFLSSFCALCAQCCQCLWIVHSWLPLRSSLTFISRIDVVMISMLTWCVVDLDSNSQNKGAVSIIRDIPIVHTKNSTRIYRPYILKKLKKR